MPESYPVPSHACTLWVAGDDLMVAFPPTGPEGRGHTIRLPASASGFQATIKILRDRAAVDRYELGNDGTPSQYTAEQYAGRSWGTVSRREREEREARSAAEAKDIAERVAAKKKAKAQFRAEAEAQLKELGLL